jgi:hypothetical protein
MAKDVAMKLPAIDKQAHFWWGWAMAASTALVVGVWSFFVASLFGWLKEEWDKHEHGTYDPMDFWYTSAGAFVGVAFYFLFR